MTTLLNPLKTGTIASVLLSGTLIATTVGCGGGISNALSLSNSSSSLNGISVNDASAVQNVSASAGKAATGRDAVSREAFAACPGGEMSPADMSQLTCIVGKYEGARLDDHWSKIGPANEKCYLTLFADGQMTVTTPGVFDRAHQFSAVKATVDTADASRYMFVNKGGNTYGSSDDWPKIFLESKFAGTGGVKWKDYFALLLSQGDDGASGSMYVWLVDSTLNDETVRCGGQLALPGSSNDQWGGQH